MLLKLCDWAFHERAVEFESVVRFRWSLRLANEHPGLRDDQVYEIEDSEWVRGLTQARSVQTADGLRHLLVGFNEEGAWLEVGAGRCVRSRSHRATSNLAL